MTNLKMIAAAALLAVPAIGHAGSLENPWERPPVATPAQPQLSWNGLYGGVGVTTREVSRTTREEIIHYDEIPTDEHNRKCTLGSSGSTHNNNKCQISQETYEYLRDTGQFDVVQNPWNSLRADGQPGDAAIYQSGYYGLWMNDNTQLSFTSTDSGDAPTNANKPTNEMFVSTITEMVSSVEEIFNTSEDREVTANVFAGYRHVFGTSGLGAGLELGTVGGAEAQIAMANGRWFTYAGFNSDQEVTLGSDRLMGDSGSWFLGGKLASGDSTRAELRIGVKF